MGSSTGRARRSTGGNVLVCLFLLINGVFMSLPLVYTVSNAFKPLSELFIFPPRLWVRNPTFDNFRDLFVLMARSRMPFSRYLFNTIFISVAGTAGHVIMASLAAYALSKHDFPGRQLMFNVVVLSLMFAPQVTAIPNYLIMSKLGWVDSHAAIIVPAWASSLGLYLMKQFMDQVPDSLLDAARIDGASEFRVFWQIVLPTVKPAWLTLIILSFQSLWGETGGRFIYSEQLKTLPYAMSQMVSGGIARAGVGAAVGLLMMIVPITVFLINQSNVVETMSTSGMTG
ncbi:MAG TPA: carbohydrate ABC transporter permease [Bacillota bacterium]|nr:carbohydrate ABC transporter permease [Bacillota bacterium]HOL51878.1 carbohydrate ABC transporter permease [Bacillota bacterium]HOO30845.1 carbohydrate ABC transporter permease [Bacillota bacterium]HPQ03002.1 carbohydrate ABC transporter permease [Bacillota bacterium]